MEEYGPHFNEPLSRPPELSWNLKTDRRSELKAIDMTYHKIVFLK